MAEIPGSRIKVRFKGQVIKVMRATVDDAAGEGDITHSELEADDLGVVPTDAIPTTKTARVTLTNATYDPAENLFEEPRGMATGATGELLIYPDGLDSDPWQFPNFLVTQGTHDFDVNNLQPVTIKGRNKGNYFPPGRGS